MTGEIVANAQKIESTVTITRAKDLYEGVMNSPIVQVRIQDYEPFDVNLRGGFRIRRDVRRAVRGEEAHHLRRRGVEPHEGTDAERILKRDRAAHHAVVDLLDAHRAALVERDLAEDHRIGDGAGDVEIRAARHFGDAD